MKIFLDTANIEYIQKYSATKLVDGVTTNPSNLSKEGGNPTAVVRTICQLLPQGEISVEITEQDPKKAYEQAKKIADLADNVIVKIPCHADYYTIIERLVKENIPLNITLVFTLIQGFMMGKLGVRYISPLLGRWDDIDVAPTDLLLELRHMMDTYKYQTGILVASIRQVRHVHEALISGADVATLSPAIFDLVMKHPLTDAGKKKFEQDWQALGVARFPE